MFAKLRLTPVGRCCLFVGETSDERPPPDAVWRALRSVSIPLRRPVVAKVGLFDRWPFVLIDLHTEEGIGGRSYRGRSFRPSGRGQAITSRRI